MASSTTAGIVYRLGQKPVYQSAFGRYRLKPPTAPAGPTPGGSASGGPASGQPTQPDVSWQDSLYNLTNATQNKQLADTSENLLNQDVTAATNSGITVARDPNNPLNVTGAGIDQNVDVTNPFSKAALLNRVHRQNIGAINTGAAASGQFYSGAAQGSQNTEGFNFQQGQDALLKEFASGHQGLIGQYLAASQAAQNAQLEAASAALARNENNPAYPGSGAGSSSGGSPARTVPKTGPVYRLGQKPYYQSAFGRYPRGR